MTYTLKKIASLAMPIAMLLSGAAQAAPGHLGNVETLGLKTGMSHDEVKAALNKLKKQWRESPIRDSGYYFDQEVGAVREAKFQASDASSSEELTLTYTKDNILFQIKRTVNWPAGARPSFENAVAAVTDKFGKPTWQRVYSDNEQLFYHTMDGGKTITGEDMPNKRNAGSDTSKCFEFVKNPPQRFSNPGNLATQDVLFAKCGGYYQFIIEPDNPNYPGKSPRAIARRMDVEISDPRIYLAAAQQELFARENKLKSQIDKAKTNGIKPAL